jgi:hypothetical protein
LSGTFTGAASRTPEAYAARLHLVTETQSRRVEAQQRVTSVDESQLDAAIAQGFVQAANTHD